MGQAENPVMYAVEQVCGLYGVQYTREQSRTFNVETGGRWRPMFFGQWHDEFGKRRFGKADFLLRPRIRRNYGVVRPDNSHTNISHVISVPLWVECKSLAGKSNSKTKADQFAFEQWVKKNGDHYMRIQEDVRPLIEWFEEHGVEKNCDDTALATVVSPLDASLLYELPCKHCGFPRDKHTGPAFGCPLHLAACNTKLIGKVWSPDLRKGIKNGKAAFTGDIGVGSERN
jgi:hypothetical protein